VASRGRLILLAGEPGIGARLAACPGYPHVLRCGPAPAPSMQVQPLVTIEPSMRAMRLHATDWIWLNVSMTYRVSGGMIRQPSARQEPVTGISGVNRARAGTTDDPFGGEGWGDGLIPAIHVARATGRRLRHAAAELEHAGTGPVLRRSPWQDVRRTDPRNGD
jgi:hypothetical protein